MKRTLILIALVLAARGAGAQERVVRLTLDDAMARGLSSSQRLAELLARKEGAEAAEAGRAAAAMPSVALVGGYTRTNHVDEFGVAQRIPKPTSFRKSTALKP